MPLELCLLSPWTPLAVLYTPAPWLHSCPTVAPATPCWRPVPHCWHLLYLCKRELEVLRGQPLNWQFKSSNTLVPVLPMGTTLRCDLHCPQSSLRTKHKLPSVGFARCCALAWPPSFPRLPFHSPTLEYLRINHFQVNSHLRVYIWETQLTTSSI